MWWEEAPLKIEFVFVIVVVVRFFSWRGTSEGRKEESLPVFFLFIAYWFNYELAVPKKPSLVVVVVSSSFSRSSQEWFYLWLTPPKECSTYSRNEEMESTCCGWCGRQLQTTLFDKIRLT